MTTTLVYLVRHGEVDPAWQGRIYGALDVPLSKRGLEQASTAAEALSSLPLRAVISSGLRRTEAGAAPLRAALGLPRTDDSELRELERGSWAGKTFEQLEASQPGVWEAWFQDPASARPPAGESLGDLLNRVRPRVQHWASAFAGEALALVVHGWVIRVLLCHALDAPLATSTRLDVRTGDISLLRWNTADGSADLLGFGLVPPLVQLSD